VEGRFTPRNLSVRFPRGLPLVPSNAQFRARAKAIYQAVAADLIIQYGLLIELEAMLNN